MHLSRTFDSHHVNRIANDPLVAPGALASGYLDASEVVRNESNVCLFDETGGFVFEAKGDGVYEVHTQFLLSGRGAHALKAAREAALYMFTRTDCLEIRTFCAHTNKAAIGLTRLMQFEPLEEASVLGNPGIVYVLTLKRWATEVLCR